MTGPWSSDIYIDSKYLECLDDGEARALLLTILHELAHFNQSFTAFQVDKFREIFSGGESSRAQDNAENLVARYDALLMQYQKNQDNGKNSCQCRK